jgi:hypothetical protein
VAQNAAKSAVDAAVAQATPQTPSTDIDKKNIEYIKKKLNTGENFG